ncbi:MAG: DUF2752 domain-containing protein [Lachnospiraceae bacterium]|nr:DUF2752 domain-containing protein [Lachnospiraceae bacterium]
MKLLLKDIRKYYIAIIITVLSLTVLHIVFHNVCLFKILFGIPCAACGLTRAGIYLLQGNVTASVRMHPLLLPVLVEMTVYCFLRYGKGYEYRGKFKRYTQGVLLITLILMFVVYFYRMYKVFPGEAPMDYNWYCLFHLYHLK